MEVAPCRRGYFEQEHEIVILSESPVTSDRAAHLISVIVKTASVFAHAAGLLSSLVLSWMVATGPFFFTD